MLTLYAVVIAMFTSAGPAAMVQQAVDKEECEAVAKAVPQILNGQRIPGPDGTEKVLVLDAQAQCVVFHQGTQAKE